MRTEELVRRLEGVRRTGSGWSSRCPSHADRHNSLSISQASDGRILIKCHAGCDAEAIVAALGLQMRDLFGEGKRPRKERRRLRLDDYCRYVGVEREFLTQTFRLEEVAAGVAIPYFTERHELAGTQIRQRLEKGKTKDARFFWIGRPYLYAAWLQAEDKARLMVVEGASDVHVLWRAGIPAIGVPGANAFKPEWTPILLPFDEIDIVQEPGGAGQAFVKKICDALRAANYRGRVRAVALADKDPRDVWLKHGGYTGAQGFREEIEAAIMAAPVIDLYPAIPLTRDIILGVAEIIVRHVFLKNRRMPLLLATWVVATYVADVFKFFGYLWINSAVRRCGKSLLEDVLAELCCRATRRLANVTEAVIFRLADAGHTLILDEIENLRGEDREKHGAIMAVLNAGFQAGGTVPRVERVKGGGFSVVNYKVFGPKVLAGISRLADTIEDRCFRVQMVPKTPSERVQRFNLRKVGPQLERLRAQIAAWADARREAVAAVYDELPDEMPELSETDDRFRDIAEPLVAVASYADAEAANGEGRLLPELFAALRELGGARRDAGQPEALLALLKLIENVVGEGGGGFISSTELLEKVKAEEELAWIRSTRALANFLARFELMPRRDHRGVKRGYWITREWLEEIRGRYAGFSSACEASETSESQSGRGLKASSQGVRESGV